MFNFTILNDGSKLTPLVLLHGWGGNLKSLEPLQKSLSRSINNPIYNLELPGFGTTSKVQESMQTADFSKFVSKFINEKKLNNPILIGHSFGGKVSVDIASGKLFEISKLILISASGIEPKNKLKKTLSKFISKLTPKNFKDNNLVKKMIYKYLLRENDYLKANEMKSTLAKVVEEHYDNKIGNISLPTLIIWGENDSYVPLWMGEKYGNGIKNSELIVVPSATHGLPLKSPDIVAEIISNWIKK